MISKTYRRQFLVGMAAASLNTRLLGRDAIAFPPTRQITRGPGFHWFGYYDKLQFSPDNRFVLSNKVNFEHRSPTAEDRIEVGMIDLNEKDRFVTSTGPEIVCNWGAQSFR